MSKCYLRIGSDYLDDACLHDSIKDAKETFERAASQLNRFGQRLEASIHLYDRRVHDTPHCNDYPDLVLKLGPRGGLVTERT